MIPAQQKAEQWINSKSADTLVAMAHLGELTEALKRAYAHGYNEGALDEIAKQTSFFRERNHG